tara:strand:- start:842 stop:1042 length:201 start_codon:yes stop_codon:yes gene_type:complete
MVPEILEESPIKNPRTGLYKLSYFVFHCFHYLKQITFEDWVGVSLFPYFGLEFFTSLLWGLVCKRG